MKLDSSSSSEASQRFFLRYNLDNFYAGIGPSGVNINGPIWRPVRLVMNLNYTAFVLIVPVLYGIIFR